MIDEQIIERAICIFSELTSGRWPISYTEIQDDGDFLFIQIVVADIGSFHIDDETRKNVATSLNALMPIQPKEPTGAWLVGFFSETIALDVIMPFDA
jgi:hypothetical protein